jgi:hypothetical protein
LLIFIMISSLANFLMLILYHGDNPQRVSWTILMFTMGSVAVARIAIEQDRNYSIMYASALGLAAFVVMIRFVDNPVFCALLLALIGYLADRIVHDCTLIDESIDSSGQGLMDAGAEFVQQQMQATGAADKSAAPEQPANKRRRKTHQPGRTVMYLALAALPLFGLGQFLMRGDPQTWGGAQKYLALYLFSSLSLLVTTSFLGLRRYLRQRQVEMPGDVTIAWLVGGLVIIASILGVAYLAPVPGQMLSSLELPAFLDSPQPLGASKYGWGDEAAEQTSPDAATTPNEDEPEGKDIQSVRPQEGAPPGDSGDGQGDQGPTGKQQGGKQSGGDKSGGDKSGGDKSGGDKSGGDKSGGDKSGGEPSGGEPSGGDKSGGDKSGGDKSGGDKSGGDKSGGEQSGGEQSRGDKSGGEQSGSDKSGGEEQATQQADREDSDSTNSQSGQDEASTSADRERAQGDDSDADRSAQQDSSAGSDPATESESSESTSSFGQTISNTLSTVGGFLRYLIMLVLFIIVAAFLWLNRDAIARWWRQLFNRDSSESPDNREQLELQSEPGAPPRPFASFRNPIGSEKDPRRIVVITFQAFEAWSRERGWTREKDETPSEFIRRIAGSVPQFSGSASEIVEAYNRIVYGRGKATQRDMNAAKQVWQAMQS